jgi:hypothetical protein
MKLNGRILIVSLLVGIALVLTFASVQAQPAPITVTVCITDSGNNNITPASGSIYYKLGSTAFFANNVATNGCRTQVFPAGTTNLEVWAVINNTTSAHLIQDISVNPQFNFFTKKMSLRLEQCDGTPLNGATPRFGSGANFGTWFWPGGQTGSGSNAAGESAAEVFTGGTFSFDMGYKGTAQQQLNVVIQDPPQKLVWQTTKVTLLWPGQISYGGPAGNSAWFTQPSMELMPGTVKFHFRPVGAHPGYTTDLTFGGCIYTGGFLTLIDEAGNPMANYPADYPAVPQNLSWRYRCGGSWGPTTSFQTDAYGKTPFNITCGNWDKKITMTLNQTSIEQNETERGLTNDTWQAAKVNANLKTCTGPITDTPGGVVDQGGGYWYNHGTTGPSGTVSFYTFPTGSGTIKVRMSYNHKSPEQFPTIVAGTNNVDFTTTALTFTYAGDIKSNTGGSWWNFTKPTMNLLPGDYDFYFQSGSSWIGPVTVSVSGCAMNKALLRVVDENGNGVAGATATPAMGGSWQPQIPGATDANGNLFVDYNPAWTKIKMTVNQGGQEQSAAQMLASNYTWTTEILRIWLWNNAGSAITDGAAFLQQGGGYWYDWGYLNSSGYKDIQLFAGNYKFKVTYNYTGQEKFPVLSVGAGITDYYFQTGQVFGSCITQYSTGTWRTFTDGMQLMPGTYTFRYPSQPGTVVTAGGTTNLTCPP